MVSSSNFVKRILIITFDNHFFLLLVSVVLKNVSAASGSSHPQTSGGIADNSKH